MEEKGGEEEGKKVIEGNLQELTDLRAVAGRDATKLVEAVEALQKMTTEKETMEKEYNAALSR